MRYLWLCSLVLAGCVNLSVALAPVNPAVKPERTGEVCETAVVLPILWGHLTVEEAMKSAEVRVCTETETGFVGKCVTTVPGITKVHSLELTDFGVPFYTEVCLKVTGE